MSSERKQPEVLTEKECQALAAVANPRYLTGLRDQCVIRLLLNTGLKISECLNLKTSDIDRTSGELRVEGKGARGRTLWVNEEVLSVLRKWLKRRPGGSDYLFTTSKGGPLSGRALRAMLKRRAHKAGITKDVHPHMLRHSFATEMYHRTKDIRHVQQILGHAHLSTTMIYADTADADIELTMKDFKLG